MYLKVAVILLALSLPSIVLGRAVVGVSLCIALILTMLFGNYRQMLRDIIITLNNPVSYIMFCVVLLWGASLFSSTDLVQSLTTQIRTILYVVLIIPFWVLISNNEDLLDLCLKTLAISSIILGIIAICSLHLPSGFIGFLRGNPETPLLPVRILKESASTASLIIPLLLWSAYRETGYWRYTCLISLMVMLILIFDIESRSAVAGIIGSSITAIILYNLYKRNNIVSISSIITILFVGLITIYWLHDTRSWYADAYGDGVWAIPGWLIDPPRQAIWEFAWKAGEANRWFGVGINVIDKLPEADAWNSDTGTRNIPLHPHNWMVEIAIETGVVGLIGFLLLLLTIAIKYTVRYLRSGSVPLLALGGVWGAYWFSGLFSFSYWSSWWQIHFLVAMVICLSGDALHQRLIADKN